MASNFLLSCTSIVILLVRIRFLTLITGTRRIIIRDYIRARGIRWSRDTRRNSGKLELQVFSAFNRIALARRPKYTTWKACLHFILNPVACINAKERKSSCIFNEIYFLLKPTATSERRAGIIVNAFSYFKTFFLRFARR